MTDLTHNSDFLFIYEAIQCNPNGDPDHENKPRMDYDTQTNLVTDVRVKRYIRDYLKAEGHEIFVDMEGDSKVTMDEKMKQVVTRALREDEEVQRLLDSPEQFEIYQSLKEEDPEKTFKVFQDKKKRNLSFNIALLSGLVKHQFSDIRMFGSAFAVEGFNRAMTGPIQMNWGYSLNPVYLMESNTISSIMNEGNSTFGKDYRVKYSLLAFHGSINHRAAATTGLMKIDIDLFRESLWNSISASPTRSKLNQYPKLYLEVQYHEGIRNGYFGDLRNLIAANPKSENGQAIDPREVRRLSDLELDLSVLHKVLKNAPQGIVRNVYVKASPDMNEHAQTEWE